MLEPRIQQGALQVRQMDEAPLRSLDGGLY